MTNSQPSAGLSEDVPCGCGGPWPVRSVLTRLADAADHLLLEHDCDAHGHEGVAAARDSARAALKARALPAHEAAVRVTASREVPLSEADEAALRVPRIPSPHPSAAPAPNAIEPVGMNARDLALWRAAKANPAVYVGAVRALWALANGHLHLLGTVNEDYQGACDAIVVKMKPADAMEKAAREAIRLVREEYEASEADEASHPPLTADQIVAAAIKVGGS